MGLCTSKVKDHALKKRIYDRVDRDAAPDDLAVERPFWPKRSIHAQARQGTGGGSRASRSPCGGACPQEASGHGQHVRTVAGMVRRVLSIPASDMPKERMRPTAWPSPCATTSWPPKMHEAPVDGRPSSRTTRIGCVRSDLAKKIQGRVN